MHLDESGLHNQNRTPWINWYSGPLCSCCTTTEDSDAGFVSVRHTDAAGCHEPDVRVTTRKHMMDGDTNEVNIQRPGTWYLIRKLVISLGFSS
jgi:hypothetical protein